ncbi:hypothetical protein Pla52n_48490 [Stieleria varia]|uniref:Uncharacterized protein n=1 Tax=Stieleria varia TaxID=2528005 RepID=A0A5C6AFX5_9BACT|nr:hypothetical protein Pla52n_48490 [Stieleria varia]
MILIAEVSRKRIHDCDECTEKTVMPPVPAFLCRSHIGSLIKQHLQSSIDLMSSYYKPTGRIVWVTQRCQGPVSLEELLTVESVQKNILVPPTLS